MNKSFATETVGTARFRYATGVALLLGVLLFTVALVGVRPAAANGNCNLAALQSAVTAGGNFDFNCATDTTISVSEQLEVAKNLALTNTGAGKVTISGDTKTRIFYVNLGTANDTFSLNNLYLTQGLAEGNGGAILALVGNISITNSTLYSNTASGKGGAIHLNAGTINVTNSNLYSNTAQNSGGAISTTGDGILNIENSSLYANESGSTGGALYSLGTTVVSRTVLYNNIAAAGGGAIYNTGATFRVLGASLYGNNASSGGGAIYNSGSAASIGYSSLYDNSGSSGGAVSNSGSLLILNSSLYGNSAFTGGAIFNTGQTLLTYVTLADNTINACNGIHPNFCSPAPNGAGPGQGAAIFNDGIQVALRFSLVKGTENCYGSITDSGFNLEAEATGTYTCGLGPSSIQTTDALLGTPGNNGGPTPTIALLSGSPAMDVIPPNFGLMFNTDQRGVIRPQGKAIDIGAYEGGVMPAGKHADIIPQLRVSPDRVVATNPENLITYNFKVKNVGEGEACNLRVTIPIPEGLDVGYFQSEDLRAWVKEVATDHVLIILPCLSQYQEVSGTLVFRPNGKAVAGTKIVAVYTVMFDDPAHDNESLTSNDQQFVFGEGNRDDTTGAVQFGAPATAKAGEQVSITQNIFLADEIVSLWYTGPDGKTVGLGTQRADALGDITVVVNTTGLTPGDYAVVGYGNRSEVIEVTILTVTAG